MTHLFIFNRKTTIIATAILGLCFGQASFASSSRPEILTLRDEKKYRVTVTTSFDFPKSSPYTQVNVSHGLPVTRPWSKGERRSSARSIKFQPARGRIQYDPKTESAYVDWVERVPRAGGKLFFQTTYETTSVTRELTPEAAQKARWRNRRVTTTPEMNPEIVEMAKTLIKEPTPIDALIKFSHWLVERIRYDITVESSSVDEALLAGAGDCGPRARIMLQFCDAIGIPTKSIGGASLRFEDGGIDRINFAVKSIRSNSHAWLEVDIPGLGWLEIEPAAQDKTFKVEFHRIQTKGLAHTFRVRLEEKGKWTTTKWESYDDDEVGTRYLSDIGLSNVVTFSEID